MNARAHVILPDAPAGEWHSQCSPDLQAAKGVETMTTHVNFVQLISSVIGLSFGIGVAAATAIIAAAALLQ